MDDGCKASRYAHVFLGLPNKMIRFVCLILYSLMSSVGIAIGDDVWTTDVDAAIDAARKNDKDILLLYTGSDWCPPCKKLEEEILSTPEFLNEARQRFELVVFDFPKQKELPPKLAEQNRQWAEKFGVVAYPTVILVDRQTRPFAISGYREGGPVEYLGMLGEFRQQRIRRDEAFEKADKAADPKERAKFLDEAISQMSESIARLYYEDCINEIVKIDNEDEQGLRTKWNAAKDSEMRKMIMTDILIVSRLEKPETAVAFINEVLAELKFPADEQLQILQIKLDLLRKIGNTSEMDGLLDEMIAMDELTEQTRQRLIVKKIFLMVGTNRRESAMALLEKSLSQGTENAALWLAKGQLLDAESKRELAIDAFDRGIQIASNDLDLLIDLVGAKANAQMALNDPIAAIQTLDDFAENQQMPSDLRGEAYLQKAMIMRDTQRNRQARLAENRAIEIANSPDERAEMQKLVDRLRTKYGDN